MKLPTHSWSLHYSVSTLRTPWCGYGLYVVDNDNDSFFSIESISDVLHEVFDSFRQDGIPIKHATVCDEIIPCNSRGNLVNKKLYTLSASFEVDGGYQLCLVR